MIAWGKNKSESRVTAEFYNCAIEVMRGAEAIDQYEAMDQQEAFDIEYWSLEEAKLRRHAAREGARPPDRRGHRRRRRHRQGNRAPPRQGGRARRLRGSATKRRRRRPRSEIIAKYGEGIGVAGTRHQQLRPGDRPRLRHHRTATASRAMFDDVLLAYGGVDAVVVTAGIFVPPDTTGRMDDAQWALTFAINVTGAYIVADEAYKIFKQQGLPANIVLTTSANAVVAKKGSLAYDTSKAAANHLVRELAVEMAPLVRVNARGARHGRQGQHDVPARSRDRVAGEVRDPLRREATRRRPCATSWRRSMPSDR